MNDDYKSRIIDDILKDKLASKGAVLIEGPKWCGKTTTAEQNANSVLYISDPKNKEAYKLLAQTNPQELLEGETPRLIDEWQDAPELWDAVRFEVDHRRKFGQFILTGSAVPKNLDKISHSGTGRFTRVKMRPMSLMESGESNGKISLEKLFETPKSIYAESELQLDDICYLICRGGWPLSTLLPAKFALNQARDYLDAVIASDMNRIDGINRDPVKVMRLIRSYARLQGSQAGDDTISSDIQNNESTKISGATVTSYIKALKKIFVIEDSLAWNPNLRSKTAIRTSDTRYFIDPSIAAAALGFGPEDLKNDLKTLGLMFETMAIRDLRIYADSLDGDIYHYRDKNGLECDAVVHLRNGHYGLIEIKLGGDKLIEEGAVSLKKLEASLDLNKMKAPSFSMILTANSNIAYRRKDGIYIVPIGCLGK